MAKARCEWDALKVDPSTQKLLKFLDVLRKTAKEAFGSEAQQYIDKAIYAKMPDHGKKILNRANLEDKPYNDIVLHLEREMRLNGLGAPDEVNLVPLNERTSPNKVRDQTSRKYHPKCNPKHQKRILFLLQKIWPFQSRMSKPEKGQMATDKEKQRPK